MRKSILIFGVLLTSFSLMALGYMKWSGPVTSDTRASSSGISALDNFLPGTLFRSANKNFLYNVDSRYMSNITKEELDKARSIIDIVPKGCNVKLVSYSGVQVSILGDDTETSEMGENELLNRAQIKLLRSTDYSADFYVNANCKKRDSETGELTDHRLVYYISVIPENEAVYASGHDALINYLKENSRKEIRIAERDQLKPGKVSFIVTAKGTIAEVKLNSTSGYKSIDDKMVELIADMPGKWNAATNSLGKKVEQEYVFSFGRMGC